MSYIDKVHQKIKIDKMIKQILNSPEYQKAKKADQMQWSLQNLAEFTFIGCVYLEMTFGCKKKRLEKWVDFVRDTIVEIGKDEDYLDASEKYYKEKYGLDVLERVGLKKEVGADEAY